MFSGGRNKISFNYIFCIGSIGIYHQF